MTKREIARMLRTQMLPHLPEFTLFDSALVLAPVGLVLRCVSFSRSGWDKTRFSHVHATAMPLWVPFTSLWFGTATIDLHIWQEPEPFPPAPAGIEPRLWEYAVKIRRRAMPLFEEVGTPEALYRNLRDFARREAERRKYEYRPSAILEQELAGASIIVGDMKGAVECYDRLLAMMKDAHEEWDVQKRTAITAMIGKARRGRDEAISLLREWEALTIGHLKIQPLMDPV